MKRSGWLPYLFVIGATVIGVGALTWMGARSGSSTADVALRVIGSPAPRTRPLVVDVNGDGVEDMVLVTAIDPEGGVHQGTSRRDGGPLETFVQAIDGKEGRILYAVPQAPAPATRIVLVASKGRLGIARVPEADPASLTVHELATGRELKTLALPPSTGRACENRGGPGTPRGSFFFERSGSTGSGTMVDLDRLSRTPTTRSSCAEVAMANVVDVAPSTSDPASPATRFSPETMLRKGAGPYGGRTLVVLPSGLGYLTVERSAPESATADAGHANSSDVGVDVVGLDVVAGKTLFERPLASLGLSMGAVERIEATDRGPLLFFFADGAGLALLDAQRGDLSWSLPLSKDDRIASYALTSSRLYLHLQQPDAGRSSRGPSSRIVVVDLASGEVLRALP